MAHWAADAVFYHVYPLGMCGAPARNDGHSAPVPRLLQLLDWIDHWEALGVNAIYLGPLFESASHGYDTLDYHQVDRRLGTNEDLRHLVSALHARGIRVVLDAVYNHVGRGHPAFADLRRHGAASRYASWFSGLRFDRRSPMGDAFTYDTWAGAYELPKLVGRHPEVQAHLLEATEHWVREFDIDGLRLDAADCLELDFLRALRRRTDTLKDAFWLMGEVVHGDYRRWIAPDMLDATTNYEAYKGLYSAHNDRNYFEIAHSLTRQFGPGGVYRGVPLYAFADNHDVDRIASRLKHRAHLYPLHLMLFTMPGAPSIYYGSEWGMPGRKQPHSDGELRPSLALSEKQRPEPDLARAIARFSRLRHELGALRGEGFRTLHVASEQLAYLREDRTSQALVVVNGADQPVNLELDLCGIPVRRWRDALEPEQVFEEKQGKLHLEALGPTWGRVLIPA